MTVKYRTMQFASGPSGFPVLIRSSRIKTKAPQRKQRPMILMKKTVQFVLLVLLPATLAACGDFEWLPDKNATTTQNSTTQNNTSQTSTDATTQNNSKQMGGAIQTTLTSLSQSVTTYAGNTSGSADGTGSAAGFNLPVSVTTDGTNLYVADSDNFTIRKIVIATGAVTTLAGTAGASGSTDGVGAAARFTSPSGITTDGTSLYVTDNQHHSVRKIDIATGSVAMLAGSGTCGWADGTGTAAGFCRPEGITTDGTYLYVADNPNSGASIRKISIATGIVTTFAGSANAFGTVDGIGAAAKFNYPIGITTDGSNLYVTEWNGDTIRKIVIATGEVTTLAGTAASPGSADGVGTAASFRNPFGITMDGANLYIADCNNNTIRKLVIATGAVSTLAGTAGASGSADGVGAEALFYYPRGITTDGTNLYVADMYNNTIRKVQ